MDPSNAELMFERIMADPAKVIRQLIAASTKESEFLDFKQAGKSLDEKWSKAIAGFGSSSGGVVIYGVDARKNEDGIDCATGEVLCDVNAVSEVLFNLLPTATISPLRGVQISPIVVQGNMGFVVCFIPEGPHKPYRAEHAGKKYYIRAGSSFVEPDPNYLRNLLFPNRKYEVKLSVRIKAIPHNNEISTAQFLTLIENTGAVSISNLVLCLFGAGDLEMGVPGGGRWEVLDGLGAYAWEHKPPIHPGFQIAACRNSKQNAPLIERTGAFLEADKQKRSFYYRVYSRDQPALHGEVVFEPSDLQEGIVKEVVLSLLPA